MDSGQPFTNDGAASAPMYPAYSYYAAPVQTEAASVAPTYQEGAYPAYTAAMPQADYSAASFTPAVSKPKQSSLYKTQLCRHFEQKNFCNLGTSCSFAHGKEELRDAPPKPNSPETMSYEPEQLKSYKAPAKTSVDYSQYYKTVLCKHFEQTGQCQFGLNCKFAHGEAELRPPPVPGAYTTPSYSSYVSPPAAYPDVYSQQPASYAGFESPVSTGFATQAPMASGYEAPAAGTSIDPSQNYSYSYGSDPSLYQNYDGSYAYTQTQMDGGVGSGFPQAQSFPSPGAFPSGSQGFQQ